MFSYVAFRIFVYPLSYLPFPLLYFFSDLLAFVLHKVLGYRRETVLTNLQNAFPGLRSEERDSVAANYYKHLADLIMESIKALTMSKASLLRRVSVSNMELLHELRAKNRSVISMVGHYGNWEWAGLIGTLTTPYEFGAIYKPLSNPHFDRLFRRMRGRFGMVMVPMNRILRHMYQKKGEPILTIFVADQTPSNLKRARWIRFLNQETAVFTGAERIAQKFDQSVIFAAVEKVRRGYYRIDLKLIAEDPDAFSAEELTRMHTKILEEQIVRRPEYWIWSHKRWKHKRPAARTAAVQPTAS